MESSQVKTLFFYSLNLFTPPVSSNSSHWSVSSSCYLHIKFTIVFTSAALDSSQICLPPLTAASSFTVKTSLNLTRVSLWGACYLVLVLYYILYDAQKIKESKTRCANLVGFQRRVILAKKMRHVEPSPLLTIAWFYCFLIKVSKGMWKNLKYITTIHKKNKTQTEWKN